MGNWYQVTKHIHGRQYLYWQTTYRVGRIVKTLNKYIGPAANPPRVCSPAAQIEKLSTVAHLDAITNEPEPDVVFNEALGTEPPMVSVNRETPEHPRRPGNLHDLKREKKKLMEANISVGDELNVVMEEIDYANAVRKNRAAIRAAKRQTKGIKSLNPFMAKAMVKS